MRSFALLLLTVGGLLVSTGSASAQSIPNWCIKGCPPCGRAETLFSCPRYSGHCFYPPQQRPIPPDPWARQQPQQGLGYSPYMRSPRDFWMWQGCCGK